MTDVWYSEPFKRFNGYIHNVDLVLKLSVASVHVMREQLSVSIAQQASQQREIQDANSFEHKQLQHNLDNLNESKRFADRQSSEGFPQLYGQALTSLWRALDALAHDLLLAIIAHDVKSLSNEIRQSLTIKYSEYMELDKEDLNERLLNDIEQKVRSGLQPGIAGFEAAFNAFGLSEGIADQLKRILLEASQVRNLTCYL